MTITWTESETVKLIALYGRYECLRNPFHPDFNNKLCRYKTYKEIVNSMNIPGLTICDCIKRITYLKNQYCYELSKISAAISCEKFYKPKTSWFEIMHELLFPYLQICSNVSTKIQPEDEAVYYQEDLSSYNVIRSFSKESEPAIRSSCCLCKAEEVKVTTRSHHGRQPRSTATDSIFHVEGLIGVTSSKVAPFNHMSVGCKTSNIMLMQHEAQTDSTYITTDGNKCNNVCKMQDMPALIQENEGHTNKEAKDTLQAVTRRIDCASVEDTKMKKKYDEFDIFGKNIAVQLRSIDLETAIELEKRIQDLIIQERLNTIKSKSHNSSIHCCGSCNDYKTLSKEEICTCGLPMKKCSLPITINTSRCGFYCK